MLQTSLPFTDGFETGTSNWTISGTWLRRNSQSHNGAWAMRSKPTSGDYGDHVLELNAALDLSATTAPILTFWTKHTLITDQRVRVRVSTDGGSNWTTAHEKNGVTVTSWTQRTVDLGTYVGQSIILEFRLSYPSSTGSTRPLWWIDDVWVGQDPAVPLNQAPTVDAGSDRTMDVATGGMLNATAADDGFPNPPSSLTLTWNQTSGPLTATFSDANIEDPTVMFDALGAYVLRLTADDGESTVFDEVTITVVETLPLPFIDGFENGTSNWAISGIWQRYFNDSYSGVYHMQVAGNRFQPISGDHNLTLNGLLDLSTTSAPILTFWTKHALTNGQSIKVRVSTDGGASWTTAFEDTTSSSWLWTQRVVDLSAYAGQSITLEFQLSCPSASSTAKWQIDDVWVGQDPAVNQYPTVNAGLDRVMNVTTGGVLDATATDDGLPNPPGNLTYTWSQIGGAGTTSFSNANVEDPTVTFSGVGLHTLRLTVFDGELTTSDDVSIIVVDASGGAWSTPIHDTFDYHSEHLITGEWERRYIHHGDLSVQDWIYATERTSTREQNDLLMPTIYPIDLSGVSSPILGYSTAYNLPTHEQGFVEISVDGGTNWVTLDTLTNSSSEVCDPLCGETYFEGRQIDLSPYIGQTILLRFRFHTDAIATYNPFPHNYWYISSYNITANHAPVVNIEADAIMSLTAGGTLDATVTDDGLPYLPGSLTFNWDQVDGPGTATFTQEHAEDPSVTFDAAGDYVLRLTAGDGELTAYDEVTITVYDNQPPAVHAGTDASTTLLAGTTLAGTVNDDGWLNPTPTLIWNQVSGPGTATFSNTTIEDPTVTFDVAGDYVLRLTADDGELTAYDEVTVTVIDNQPPAVDAGADITTTLLAGIILDGTVSDDGWPQPSIVTHTWSQTSGPGTATFSDTTAEDPTVTFDVAGDYVLRLTADDGELAVYDEVTITVIDNQPPTVDAGADVSTPLLAGIILDGTVSDDGWPQPSTVTHTWSQISGPGTATFADTALTDTPVTFDLPGTYTLCLTAFDGEHIAYDEVTVTVLDVNLTLEPAAGRPQIVDSDFTLTATLTDETGQPLPGYTVDFVFAANNPNIPATTPQGITDATGIATLTYTGLNNGTDTIEAHITVNAVSIQSNAALVNWITPVEDVSTSTIWGCFYAAPDGSGGGVSITQNDEPVFCQTFPSVNFNPSYALGYSVNPRTKLFTNVTVDLHGNETGTIVAQDNGYQAGMTSLSSFEAVFTGELIVGNECFPGPDDPCIITFSVYSDDGFILGIGNGAQRVGGAWSNAPDPAVTVIHEFPIMGTYNRLLAPTEKQVIVSFPAPGIYPFEMDYSQGPPSESALTLGINPVDGDPYGLPPAGVLTINPLQGEALNTGETASFTVTAIDASGNTLAGMPVVLTVEGTNAQELTGVTNATGEVQFDFVGDYSGDDVVQASAWIQGDMPAYSAEEDITWTSVSGPSILTVPGCIGSPENQAVIAGQHLIQMATDLPDPGYWVTAVEYWPVNHPELVVSLTTDPVWVLQGATMGSGAILDTTLLANGSYVIHAVCTDTEQNPTTILDSGIMVTVTGENKPGRVKFSVTDLVVPVTGLPIAIGRTYDSLERNISGDFGYGWSLDVAAPRVEVDAANNVTLTLPNGKRTTFFFNPEPNPMLGFLITKRYTPDPGVYGSLDSNGCGLLTASGGTYFCFPGGLYDVTQFTYTDPYGREFVIEDQDPTPDGYDWQLTSITDLNDNQLTFTPDGITSSAGNLSVDFVRDGEGRITQITNPEGHVYTYGYDANGDLVSVTLPETPPIVALPIGYTYHATEPHLFVSGTDPRGNTVATAEYCVDISQTYCDADDLGRLLAVTDALGNTTTYDYDLTTASSGQTLTTITNPDGGTVELTHDETFGGKLVRERVMIESTLPTYRTNTYTYNPDTLDLEAETMDEGGFNFVTLYGYNPDGHRESVINPAGIEVFHAQYNQYGGPTQITTATGNTITVGYNANYMPESANDAFGLVGGYTWDTHGNPIERTDANGNTTELVYDPYGNVTQTISPIPGQVTFSEYDLMGRRIATTDARGNQTSYVYDALGRVEQITDPLENVTHYEYDANGNRTAVIDPLGRRTEFTYDVANRLTRVDYPDGTFTHTIYNFRGRVETQTDKAGRATTYHYNAIGQLKQVDAPNGTTLYEYDKAGRLTAEETQGQNDRKEYTYNDAGNLTHVTIVSLGEVTVYNYDNAGNRTQMTVQRPSGNYVVNYDYDARGRMEESQYADGTTEQFAYDGAGNLLYHTDQAGQVTEYHYDAIGRLDEVTIAWGTADAATTSYDYNPTGNLTTITDANTPARVTAFTYYALGRQDAKYWPDGSYELFTYDVVGDLRTHQLADGQTNTFDYDNMHRLETAYYFDGRTVDYTYTNDGQRNTVNDSTYGLTTYGYDGAGRVNLITFPQQPAGTNRSVAYQYDAAGNRTQMTVTAGATVSQFNYAYDAAHRLTQVIAPWDAPGTATDYTYEAGGLLTQVDYPNGIDAAYAYDAQNRLDTLIYRDAADVVVDSYDYVVGPAGNRTQVTEDAGSYLVWGHDDAYRLIAANRYDSGDQLLASTSFTYDPVGNRETMIVDGVQTDYTYNDLDQLTQAVTGTETLTYAYDGRGNLLTIDDGTNYTAQYQWDAADRMTQAIVSPGAQQVNYTYDADGHRVSQDELNGPTTHYLWDPLSVYGDVMLETDGTGSVTAQYALGNTRMISQQRDGTVSYFLHDGQGSTRALANTAGSITDTYNYTAFGDIYAQTGLTENPYLYTGQQYDVVTGLYSLRARYYDPGVGRFLGQDPWAMNPYNSIELNRYVYAINNPVGFVDPSGLWSLKSLAATISVNASATITIAGRFAKPIFTHAIWPLISGGAAGFVGYLLGVTAYSYKQCGNFDCIGEYWDWDDAMTMMLEGGAIEFANHWATILTGTGTAHGNKEVRRLDNAFKKAFLFSKLIGIGLTIPVLELTFTFIGGAATGDIYNVDYEVDEITGGEVVAAVMNGAGAFLGTWTGTMLTTAVNTFTTYQELGK
ncbi:MAG: Ig-like domain-containing protein [Anaerolineae bacterium]|nr:Ig-like domain-containing protein [Anaerolineae bacterium]